ncbi:hypothetical protein SAMN03159332_6215 [Paenibacillus sp. 276b]|nr:hypothetical protein SAMN03159332_6215 [Paenibacillus sp. 276b]
MITDIFTYLIVISIIVLLIFFILMLKEKNPENISGYISVLRRTIFNFLVIGSCFSVYKFNQTIFDNQLLKVSQQLADLHINLEFTNNEILMYSLVILSVFFISIMIGKSRS